MTKSYRNFLIVGTQRTGSSALAEIIDVRNDMACGWEWTQHAVPWSHLKVAKIALTGNFAYLDEAHQQHMQRSVKTQCQWLGYRRLFRSSDKWAVHPRFAPALYLDRLNGHINWLSKRPDIHIIHIVRNDNVNWLKSKFVSKAADSYVGRHYPERIKVVIPTSKAVRRLQAKQWVDNKLASLRNTNPYLRICYEDFLTERSKTISTMFTFLDADLTTDQGNLVISRQSRGSASDYVANIAELEAALREKNLLTSSLGGLVSKSINV